MDASFIYLFIDHMAPVEKKLKNQHWLLSSYRFDLENYGSRYLHIQLIWKIFTIHFELCLWSPDQNLSQISAFLLTLFLVSTNSCQKYLAL